MMMSKLAHGKILRSSCDASTGANFDHATQHGILEDVQIGVSFFLGSPLLVVLRLTGPAPSSYFVERRRRLGDFTRCAKHCRFDGLRLCAHLSLSRYRNVQS